MVEGCVYRPIHGVVVRSNTELKIKVVSGTLLGRRPEGTKSDTCSCWLVEG